MSLKNDYNCLTVYIHMYADITVQLLYNVSSTQESPT